MKTAYAEEILESLWCMYGSSLNMDETIVQVSNDNVLKEFFFVVLGGFGISYELNISALEVLRNKKYIISEKYMTREIAAITANQLRYELSLPQFEPATRQGNLRKYRFIETKPITISNAGLWLWNECEWDILGKIENLGSINARYWLCECPGLGMKSASWLLRNTGINDDCAVFDVHILRFLNKLGLEIPENLTQKSYLKLEEALRVICNKIGVSLGSMDYLLWILGRNGFLSYIGG